MKPFSPKIIITKEKKLSNQWTNHDNSPMCFVCFFYDLILLSSNFIWHDIIIYVVVNVQS